MKFSHLLTIDPNFLHGTSDGTILAHCPDFHCGPPSDTDFGSDEAGEQIVGSFHHVTNMLDDSLSLFVLGNMGVSKNRGTPKWMVYNGKPYEQMEDLGVPLFLETSI